MKLLVRPASIFLGLLMFPFFVLNLPLLFRGVHLSSVSISRKETPALLAAPTTPHKLHHHTTLPHLPYAANTNTYNATTPHRITPHTQLLYLGNPWNPPAPPSPCFGSIWGVAFPCLGLLGKLFVYCSFVFMFLC